ncbi:hypothetical protein ACFX1X_047134 [Malus domestica]
MAFWINNVEKFTHPTVFRDQSPKALEDPSIIVLQDQAQKPLKIRSSLFFKIKPKSPLEDAFITVIQDQASTALEKRSSSRSSLNGSLKIRSNPPSRSSPRPLKNVYP